jgi:hypothetical protein
MEYESFGGRHNDVKITQQDSNLGMCLVCSQSDGMLLSAVPMPAGASCFMASYTCTCESKCLATGRINERKENAGQRME